MSTLDSPLFPLTPSKWNTFDNCPYRAMRQFILKDVKDSSSDALIFGTQVHKHLEFYVRNHKKMPLWMDGVLPKLDKLLGSNPKADVYVELFQGMDESFTKSVNNRRGEGVALRLKTDLEWHLGNTAIVIDYKTGKPRSEDRQLHLQALAVFAKRPEIEVIFPQYWYLKFDTKKVCVDVDIVGTSEKIIRRSEVPELSRRYMEEMSFVEFSVENDEWPKQPSPLCGWCPVSDCENWIDRRDK